MGRLRILCFFDRLKAVSRVCRKSPQAFGRRQLPVSWFPFSGQGARGPCPVFFSLPFHGVAYHCYVLPAPTLDGSENLSGAYLQESNGAKSLYMRRKLYITTKMLINKLCNK